MISTTTDSLKGLNLLDQKRIDKLFTVADLNSDNKLNLQEFIKIIEDFLDPHYLESK
jgi:Ca2+-binding EF-hand superfamily protein